MPELLTLDSPLAAAAPAFAELSVAQLRHLGPVLVLLPRPGDEARALGGTIAHLRALGVPVRLLLTTDGSAAPLTTAPAGRAELATQCVDRMRVALAALGLDPRRDFASLCLPEGALPAGPDRPGFAFAVRRVSALLRQWQPATVLVPWRHAATPDHRATWQIAQAAVAAVPTVARWFEYGPDPAQSLTPTDDLRGWEVALPPAAQQARQAALAVHAPHALPFFDEDVAASRASREQLLEAAPRTPLLGGWQ